MNKNEKGENILSVNASIFDTCERHENCIVEIWTNSVTGEVSVGWWENEEE